MECEDQKGVIKIQYFQTEKENKTPEAIKGITAGLAIFVEKEKLPNDFTRFRRMAERKGGLAK